MQLLYKLCRNIPKLDRILKIGYFIIYKIPAGLQNVEEAIKDGLGHVISLIFLGGMYLCLDTE